MIAKSKADCVLIVIVTSSGLASDAAPRNAPPEAEVEATGDIGATRISAAIFSHRKRRISVKRTSKLKKIMIHA